MTQNGPMKSRQVDQAAFGVVYGSITVLALLMATHPPIENAGGHAAILFGSVFAVALAKAFAEICERMLQTGSPATWHDVREVWQHSQTVLLAANGPTLAFVLAAIGAIRTDVALPLAQTLALSLLAYFGARIGWRISGRTREVIIGAGITCGIGALVSLLKLLVH